MTHSEMHSTVPLKAPDDPTLQLPSSIASLAIPLLIGGIVALLAGVILAAATDLGIGYGMGAYLTAYMFCLTVSLGGLFFVIIQHLCRAGWSATVRRISELLMIALPGLAVMFLPILGTLWFGDGTLYRWDDPGYDAEHHIPSHIWLAKTSYLQTSFFTIRAVVYFAIWIILALFFYRNSKLQDQTGEVRLTERMQWWSGPALILFSISVTGAAFDWLMSLAPMWFSTMFGVYVFTGSVLSSLAMITVLVYWFQRSGAVQDEVTLEHYHDLGKLIFGFIVFWAYIAFSQYLLIWYGNIPEETVWFFVRQQGTWTAISIALVLLHWLAPFLALMSRHVRRWPLWMFGWSIYLLVMHYVDLYWVVMPEVAKEGTTGGALGLVCTLLCLLGTVGLYLGGVLKVASGVALIPVRDPRLPESLAFENI